MWDYGKGSRESSRIFFKNGLAVFSQLEKQAKLAVLATFSIWLNKRKILSGFKK